MVDKGMIHIPDGMEQDGVKCHDTTQNHMKLKTYELFVSGFFFLKYFQTVVDLGELKLWKVKPQVRETLFIIIPNSLFLAISLNILKGGLKVLVRK